MDDIKKFNKSLASKEYRDKHNYLPVPGEKRPYTQEEIALIEERLLHIDADVVTKQKMGLLVRQIAKELERSVAGIWDWVYRNVSGKYKSATQRKREKHQEEIQLKAAGKWNWTYNCPEDQVKFIPSAAAIA